MSQHLAPSEINFVRMTSFIEESDVIDLCDSERVKVPPIQVARKNGAWFALNNLSLQLARHLEKRGMCTKVKVDIIPLNKIPESVQGGMVPQQKCQRCGSAFQEDQQQLDAESLIQNQRKHYCSACENESRRTNEKEAYNSMELESHLLSNSISLCQQGTSNERIKVDNEATFANENVINEPTSSDEEVGNESESSDEELICAVCDRCFSSAKQLAKHQMDKKHFSCSICEAIFTSLLALEEHKENLEHWSEDEEAAFANPRALNVDIETQIKDIERLL